jgi:hypothetical protein
LVLLNIIKINKFENEFSSLFITYLSIPNEHLNCHITERQLKRIQELEYILLKKLWIEILIIIFNLLKVLLTFWNLTDENGKIEY